MSIAAALRVAIQSDGRSLNALARESGVDSGQLSRFLRAERSLTVDSADMLIAALGLDCELVKGKRRRSK